MAGVEALEAAREAKAGTGDALATEEVGEGPEARVEPAVVTDLVAVVV